MTHHIIIGGGPAATNAIESIRQFESERSEITLISSEPAHSRMALPYWLAGQIPREHTLTADDAYFEKLFVTPRIGNRVIRIDPASNGVTLDDGSQLNFDNLLIATGSSPVAPPIPGSELPGVQTMWSLDDTDSALKATESVRQPRVLLVGAGFVGFIVLNAMFKRGWNLTVVERESQVLPRMLDAASAGILQDWLAERSVAIHTDTTVAEIREADSGARQVELEDGQELEVDLVILATGIRPNLDLVDGAGIKTDVGILVNDQMQTNFANIYAGGDVAQGPVLFSDQPEIHAIQPTAVDHGRVAGANMAGNEVHYPGSLSMNVVDVCGLQTASYGKWNEAAAESVTIENGRDRIYRKFLWTGDQLTGAVFTGRASDVGMLTDIGMVKGIMQSQTPLGAWKDHLRKHPFDVRRAYIGAGVAQKLVRTTLTGGPSKARSYRFSGAEPKTQKSDAHAVYVGTKP